MSTDVSVFHLDLPEGTILRHRQVPKVRVRLTSRMCDDRAEVEHVRFDGKRDQRWNGWSGSLRTESKVMGTISEAMTAYDLLRRRPRPCSDVRIYAVAENGTETPLPTYEEALGQRAAFRDHLAIAYRNLEAASGVLRRIVAAWREDEIGQIDGGLIEEAEALLGIEPEAAAERLTAADRARVQVLLAHEKLVKSDEPGDALMRDVAAALWRAKLITSGGDATDDGRELLRRAWTAGAS